MVPARRLAEQTRSLFQFCFARGNAAFARWVLDGDTAHLDVADQATTWLEPRDSGLVRSFNHGWLVHGWLAVGRNDRARWHAARALQRMRRLDLLGAGMACRALALHAAAAGDCARAQQWMTRAEQVATRRDSAHEAASNRLAAARLALARSQPDEARTLAHAALDRFEALAMPWHAEQARAMLCWRMTRQ